MKTPDISQLNPKDYIIVKGARQHNLKNIDVAIPRNKLVVITGLSGSGKSSLAFDTIFAEGQRLYVESLSAYARQFLGRLEKPKVDYIKGLSPAIAIEQKVLAKNPRSTVGTITEIYDYLKLLYARIGQTISPISGQVVKKQSVTDVVNYVLNLPVNTKCYITCNIILPEKRTLEKHLEILSTQGFSRVLVNNIVTKISELNFNQLNKKSEVLLLVDRFTVQPADDTFSHRIADSTQTAFIEGKNTCLLITEPTDDTFKTQVFSNLFELDGMLFEEPDLNFFSFNNPIGACKRCEGYGSILGIDADLIIPNKNLSVFEKAIICWNSYKQDYFQNQFIKNAHHFNFPIHKPIKDLSSKEYQLLWDGNNHFTGLTGFFKQIEKESYKMIHRLILSRYRGKTACPECRGSRLRKDTNYVKINGKCLSDIVLLEVTEVYAFFQNLELNDFETKIAKRILIEINNRLTFLINVGLGYLTLNRVANTLSGGESQRINLSTSLGSSLVGSLYILDEPSIGLHARDTENLIKVLRELQQLGNTVIVVEHDEDMMLHADEIIDIGPMAGHLGGSLVFQGNHKQLLQSKNSITAAYLTHKQSIEVPTKRRTWTNSIQITNCNEHNLKNVTVEFPLGVLCCISGVSGSGKSTLVSKVLYTQIKKQLDGSSTSHFKQSVIKQLEFVDQNPIGKSTRSNPATYTKAYDDIRTLFGNLPLSKNKGFTASHFSFNTPGGRCPNCDGEGIITVEMQFMANVELPCEECKGQKFINDVLEVKYKDHNIFDILNLTVDEAILLFGDKTVESNRIINKLIPLQKVGLGYVHLGQSSNSLSGGEAQRVKLASFLIAGNNEGHTLFIFDEPTTGLHFHDVAKLLKSFDELLKFGHSIILIEHHLEVLKFADWIIDMGPEGGKNGGYVVATGTPETVVKNKQSVTGQYLKCKLKTV